MANTHSLAVRARSNSGPLVWEWVLPTCSHLIILLWKAVPVVCILASLITVASRVAVSAKVVADGQTMTHDGCNVDQIRNEHLQFAVWITSPATRVESHRTCSILTAYDCTYRAVAYLTKFCVTTICLTFTAVVPPFPVGTFQFVLEIP